MIVKIQLALYPPNTGRCLVYNVDRTFYREFEPIPEVIRLVLLPRTKAFFEATVIHDSLNVGAEVPDPGW